MSEEQQQTETESSFTLIQVEVCGEPIDAACDGGEHVWVSVRRVCEVLGLAPNMQIKKLKRKPWAVCMLNISTGPDGKNYSTFCISHRSLAMWLATIEPSRSTSPDLCQKLLRFQIEAADVLTAHFFGARVPTRVQTSPEVLEFFRLFPEVLRELASYRMRGADADDRPIGKVGAKHYILIPLREAARHFTKCVPEDARELAFQSIRKTLENFVRTMLGMPGIAEFDDIPISRLEAARAAVAGFLELGRHLAKASVPVSEQLVLPFAKGPKQPPKPN